MSFVLNLVLRSNFFPLESLLDLPANVPSYPLLRGLLNCFLYSIYRCLLIMCKYDLEETYMVNYVTHKYGTEFSIQPGAILLPVLKELSDWLEKTQTLYSVEWKFV